MEAAMATQNLLPKNVARADLDQRAREALNRPGFSGGSDS
jgi:hypothetical protein